MIALSTLWAIIGVLSALGWLAFGFVVALVIGRAIRGNRR